MTRNVWSFSTETNKDLTNIFKKKKREKRIHLYIPTFFSTVFPQFLGAHLWVYNVLWSGILSLSSIFIPSLCSLLLFESPRCGRSRWLWKWCWQRERESRTNEREFFFPSRLWFTIWLLHCLITLYTTVFDTVQFKYSNSNRWLSLLLYYNPEVKARHLFDLELESGQNINIFLLESHNKRENSHSLALSHNSEIKVWF